MKAIHITGPNKTDWREIDLPRVGRLEALQKAVGGYIERVPVASGNSLPDVWINEEGRIQDPPLPVCALWTDATGHVIEALCGPVVISRETKDLSNDDIRRIKAFVHPVHQQEPHAVIIGPEPCTRCKGSGHEPLA